MPSLDTIILVTLAGFALSASPGPSMLYVLSRSLGQTRSAGLMSAAGLAVGGMVHAVAAAAGLSALLAHSPTAYSLLTILGAAYLIYLGAQMYLSRNEELGAPERVRAQPLWRIFYQGMLVEMLNPKTALFFVAFLPQFINASADTIVLQVLLLGMLIPLTAVPSDLIVAYCGGTILRRVSANATARNRLNCVGALFLTGLGLRILLGGG